MRRGAVVLGLALLAAVLALALPGPARAAGPATTSASPAQPALQQLAVGSEPAELRYANRPIVLLHAELFGATPRERVEATVERIDAVVAQGGPLRVSTRSIPEGVALLIDDRLIFRVLEGDVDAEAGETAREVAARAARNLQLAIDETMEARNTRAIATAIGASLLATAVLAGLLWLLIRVYRWTASRIVAVAERRSARLAQTLGQHVTGQLGLARLAVAPVRLVAVLVVLLFVYEWLAVVLKQFPYTRPWGERLLSNLVAALGEFLLEAMHAIPGLLFVLLIFMVARFFVRLLRAFFDGVEQGRVRMVWVDETTARPTGRLLAAVVWLLALVAAYPYIPGSGSEAFRGIGVFVGLMLSIGSSGVVNQAVSGLMLMYTRSFRPGEFVRVGDTEGTVRAIGFLTTQIETPRREQVTIPNAVIVGNVMRNFSRFREGGGARATTTVTIGYDTPWRQVQAMLRLAAERTAGVMTEPPPRILQTGLLDHAVEYTVLVSIDEPAARALVLDALHASILDVFNEHGVQIMSPRYEADPEQPKVVPRQEWYRAPASAAVDAPRS
jgi:small-conductance mechanosensitive channel